jgi:hypothetical protein
MPPSRSSSAGNQGDGIDGADAVEHLDMWLLFLVCLGAPAFAAWAWFRRLRRDPHPPAWLRRAATAATGIEVLCLVWAYAVEPEWLSVSRLDLPVPGLGGELTVVQLSDLHLDGRRGFQERTLAAVAAAAPDLIALTGDYLNPEGTFEELERFLRRLTEIAPPGAVFAVRGNFESEFDTTAVFARAGVPLLEGTVVTFTRRDSALQIAGLAYRFDFARADAELRELAQDIAPGPPALLLTHAPDLAESEGIQAFSLVLTGHTHGGQVRLPGYGAFITLARHGRTYQAGLYPLARGPRLYVSRGLGVEPSPAPRLRFFCRPEVTVLRLHDPELSSGVDLP